MSNTFPRSFTGFFSVLISWLMLLYSLLQGVGTATTAEMPKTPDDFVPAIRFVVCSDTHNKNDRVAEMIERCYELYDNDNVYPGIDLFAFCGDMTSVGHNNDQDAFKETVDSHLKGETQALVLLGNHELKNIHSRDYFKELYGLDPEQHITVKGFHFISVSNSSEFLYSPTAKIWAAKEVKKAINDAPQLPVFTFQHPHNFATVYGSTTWASPELTSAWNGKSNVVNFSGHSHFPMNDPRSIWQGSYTALGTGGMSHFELDKNFVIGQHPDGYQECAQFYIVEADLDGSVKILCYDLISDSFFGEEYYIENVNDKSTFAYSYKNRMNNDSEPVWNEDANVSVQKNDAGESILTFDEAKDNYIVHNYKIKVKSKGILIYSKTHLSDYYLNKENNVAEFNLGKLNLKDGKEYEVEITAYNAYHKFSKPFTCKFIAE